MIFKYLFFLSFFFAPSLALYSQKNTTELHPLKEVLLELEKQFDVKFTYKEIDVADKFVVANFENDSIDFVLQKLQIKTQLSFEKITERYIAISNKIPLVSICGVIFDSPFHNLLEGATIMTSSKKWMGTNSDNKGYFSLNMIPLNDTIKISFVGFKSKKILAKDLVNSPCSSIELTEVVSMLGEVIIRNYLAEGVVKRTDGSEMVTNSTLGILPGLTEPDVLQSIQLLPGIQSPNETASDLHIRGGTPDQNLILFDGIKMYNVAHFFGMVGAFNPYIAKDVKVYRSGARAQYGNHTSGVIDIQSDNVIPEKFKMGFGSNLTHADIYAKIPIKKKFGIIVSARRSHTDIFNTLTFRNMSNKAFQNTIITDEGDSISSSNVVTEKYNVFYYNDFNTKLLFKPGKKNDLELSLLYNSNTLDYFLTDTSINESSNHVLNFLSGGVSLLWNRKWNKNLTQKTRGYYSFYDLFYGYVKIKDSIVSESIGKLNQINEVYFQSQFDWVITKKISVNLGVEISDNTVNFNLTDTSNLNSRVLEEERTNVTKALFGEYVYRNKDKTTLHFGLRYNYFSLTKKKYLSPRFYSQYKIRPNLWIKASGELKQQNIRQITELFTVGFGLENQLWALSNGKDIPIVRSHQFSFGSIFKKNDWIIDVDFYQKHLKGITTYSKGFVTPNSNDYSKGTSLVHGFDLFIKKKWTNYNTWISYSFGKNSLRFNEINNRLQFASNNDIRHKFGWTNSFKVKRFDFSLGWTFRTGVPYTNATGIDASDNTKINYGVINAERLPAYHKLDFSATYHFNFFKKWEGKVGFSVLNLYNQKNILKRTYKVFKNNDSSTSLIKKEILSIGITPNVVLRIKF